MAPEYGWNESIDRTHERTDEETNERTNEREFDSKTHATSSRYRTHSVGATSKNNVEYIDTARLREEQRTVQRPVCN